MSFNLASAPQVNYLPANSKIKYYYKLSEKEDLDAFVNSIFQGNYELQQITYMNFGANVGKVLTVPVLTANGLIFVDDEIEEGLYLVRIKVYNTNWNSVNVTPYLNGNFSLTYSIPAYQEYVIYDIFTKEKGNYYYIELPAGLALIEFSLTRVFEKENRIVLPQRYNASGLGSISLRLRRGTYAIKIPYSYTNASSSSYTNLQVGSISTSLKANVPLIVPSISSNGSGSGTFVVYLKIAGDYEDVTINISYNAFNVTFTIGLEVEQIDEFIQSTNFLSQSVTLSGSQVTEPVLNVKGTGTHLRLKYASVSGLTTAVTQCQLQVANLNRNSTYTTVWDFIAGGNSTPSGWSVNEVNSVQLVANGGTSTTSVAITLLLLYEVVAGELS